MRLIDCILSSILSWMFCSLYRLIYIHVFSHPHAVTFCNLLSTLITFLVPFPQHKKRHAKGGCPRDSRCHPAGVWRMARCDSSALWGSSVQRPWDWQTWRGHHHHLCLGFSWRQLTLRWGGGIPCPCLFSRPRHRRGHPLWLRWALDPGKP